ncbi:MAG: DUF1080 domain-containing protein [Phycisphaeraceae bacterium]|nr:DUF1080 domain-containing protein [Phycisphaeraceae bacterium]
MRHLIIAIAALSLASPAFTQEETLITLLKSDASTREKADACRELSRVGTKQAVPALSQLLTDQTLSHMARYALEPIADPSVDAALRSALGKLKGSQLVGVIDSLGVRKDTKAVESLAPFLTDADPAVVQAAARTLGGMGGAALPVLENALTHGLIPSQPAVCEGLFRCAEAMPDAEAVAIYDRVRLLPDLPFHIQVAAMRGAILRRGIHGVPLLIETLWTEEPMMASAAAGISMDIPGQAMTVALIRELSRATMSKRLLLVQTLGYRGDPAAASALMGLAQTGSAGQRVAAIHSLAQLGDASAIPALVASAKDADASVSSAAQAALIGFPGRQADAAVVSWLNESDGTHRVAAMDVAGQRRITAAVQPLLTATGDAHADVVNASFKTLGELAGVAEIPAIVNAMLKTQAVAAAEASLSAICARHSDKTLCAQKLLPGFNQAQGKPRLALLRVLRTVGDAKALAAVRAAATESDTSVKDTALRALCDWPTVNALPDLAKLAKTTTNRTFRILALRGQLRLIPMQSDSDAQKLSQLKAMLPLIDRTEEQRLVLAVLGQLPSAESLAIVMSYLTQEALKNEASVTAVGIGENIVATYPAEVAEAMKQIQTNNDKLAARVRALLASAKKDTAEAGFMTLFNGKDLTGWDGKPGWWTVQDGALTAESTPDKPCRVCNYLTWRDGQPADFELLADFKLSGKGNSGIQIRSEPRPSWDTYGYQADMTGDGELIGFVYHHKYALIAGRGTKAIFTADNKSTVAQINDPAALLKHYKLDDWNQYRVVCDGPDITLYINGVLMCQITDHRVAEAARHGLIALQMHPGPPMKIQFKNIRLKVLD